MSIEDKVKLKPEILAYFNSLEKDRILSNFGDWTNDLPKLKNDYSLALPFEHVIINNFLNRELAEKIADVYPENLNDYHFYNNPVEVKYAHDNINKLNSELRDIFYLLSTTVMEKVFSELTSVNLESDPYLHGAGLHLHPRNGRLGIHLDYEIHPISGKQRSLNIILYLSKNWDDEWNGHSELWDQELSKEIVKSPVVFNSAIVFKTNEISWHGVSKKIMCPEGTFRKTFAFYYVSDKTDEESHEKVGDDGSGYRKKATFVYRPDEVNKERIEPFLKIRPLRRITDEDIQQLWPEWNQNDY